MRTFLRRLTRNDARADELAQEVFLRVFQMGARWREVDDERAYLYRLAYRRFLDDHRRDARREALRQGEVAGPDSHGPSGAARLDIARAMDTLPPERRACALLCLALGHSHADASRILDLPLGTVKSHVARAKSALQAQLSAYKGALS